MLLDKKRASHQAIKQQAAIAASEQGTYSGRINHSKNMQKQVLIKHFCL